jgi:hypothetical protein
MDMGGERLRKIGRKRKRLGTSDMLECAIVIEKEETRCAP